MFDLDPYAILKTSADVSDEALKSAWRARLREHHPDRFAGAPATVLAAAEEMTQLINGAYTAARDQRESSQTGHLRPSRQAYEIPTAQRLVRQAQVITEYADALMDRWRTGLALIRSRRRGIEEAKKVIDEGLARHAAVANPIDALSKTLRHAARRIYEIKILNPIQRVLTVAESAAERAENASGDRRNGVLNLREMRQAQEEIRRCASDLKQLEHNRAQILAEALVEARQKVAEGIRRFEERLKLAERAAADAATASRRARELYRGAQEEGRSVPAAIASARGAVDRALLLAGTASGLANIEHSGAKGAEALWLSERLVTDANELLTDAGTLDQEQQRADEVLPILDNRMTELRALVEGARQGGDAVVGGVRTAREDFKSAQTMFGGLALEVWQAVEMEATTLSAYVSDSVSHVEQKAAG